MADTYTGQDAVDYASRLTGLGVDGKPIKPEKDSLDIPASFRDYQPQHFTVDGFNALSPFEQDQINQTLSGFNIEGEYSFMNRFDRMMMGFYDDEGEGETLDNYHPETKNQWIDYLERVAPERAPFVDEDGYGVEDEMRYMHSLFDDENLEIPVVEEEDPAQSELYEAMKAQSAAGKKAHIAEMAKGAGDAAETTEEEVEEEEEIATILTNASTQVTKENAKVSLNRTSAKDGGTQGYKKSNLANVTTSKNSNLNIK